MTPSQIVRQEYPNAKVLKIGTKQRYEVWADDKYLGQGQSKKAAWKAAYNNTK